MKLARRTVLVLAALLASPALAHHGWRWTDEGDFELTGIITAVQLGNPHGVLTIDAEGEDWRAEVGQPYRNEAAGLTDDMLVIGTEITLLGQRSADPAELVMKAERVTIAGKTYDLYPERL
ncbi:MAG: DUF6152 family protein [Paracoccaceae bacterium]